MPDRVLNASHDLPPLKPHNNVLSRYGSHPILQITKIRPRVGLPHKGTGGGNILHEEERALPKGSCYLPKPRKPPAGTPRPEPGSEERAPARVAFVVGAVNTPDGEGAPERSIN